MAGMLPFPVFLSQLILLEVRLLSDPCLCDRIQDYLHGGKMSALLLKCKLPLPRNTDVDLYIYIYIKEPAFVRRSRDAAFGPAPPLSVPRRRWSELAAFRGPCAALARSLRRHPRGRIAPSQLEGYPSRRPPPHPLRNLHRRWLGPPPPPPPLGPTPPPLVAQASAFLSFCEDVKWTFAYFLRKRQNTKRGGVIEARRPMGAQRLYGATPPVLDSDKWGLTRELHRVVRKKTRVTSKATPRAK
ncbi:hypothetical protein Scep_013891 [Stephania cephalantha]|uniref:Uncharacterized protein n=1 Tax=Stephania cephalantha TaxID=152367 RepID=A0AAP0J109_9MAGN